MRCWLLIAASAGGTGYSTLPQRRHSSRRYAAAVAKQQYESPELEPLILSDSKTFDEKIAGITAYYERRPFAVARPLSAIAAAAARRSAASPPGLPAPSAPTAARAERALAHPPRAAAAPHYSAMWFGNAWNRWHSPMPCEALRAWAEAAG